MRTPDRAQWLWLRTVTAALVLALVVVAAYRIPSLRHPARTPLTVGDIVARSDQEYVRAAHWFGAGWPANFWNTHLESRAADDFDKLRSDGFNTVVLLVPWPGFAPDERSGRLDPDRVSRLVRLMRLAHANGLRVILRVAYAWDLNAEDAGDRQLGVWTDPAIRAGWLEHLTTLCAAVCNEPGLLFGFFSWEDLWSLVSIADANAADRLRAADATGFRRWLEKHHPLDSVSALFGQPFSSWTEVPIPLRRTPAFRLLLEFLDHAWIEDFFLPAQQRFPRLSMEVRLDADPIWDADSLVAWYSHESAWDLPGADWTTVYWSPAMGGLNKGESIEPDEAARRLQHALSDLQRRTGARQIFVGQFLAEDYTPGHESNGRIPRARVQEFLRLATPHLYALAGGYGVWTWTDYAHDAIANPEFHAGLLGWSTTAGTLTTAGHLRLPAGATVSTLIRSADYHVPGGPATVELCLEGQSADAATANVTVSLNDRVAGAVALTSRGSTACTHVTVQPQSKLVLRPDRDVILNRVSSIAFVQTSGLRDLSGQPRAVRQAWVDLNRGLDHAPLVEVLPWDDGWIGRSLAARLPRPATERPAELRFVTHLPAGWPVRPRLRIAADGHFLADVPCTDGAVVSIPVPAGRTDAAWIRIDAAPLHAPPGDARQLGCVVRQLELVAAPASGPNAQ